MLGANDVANAFATSVSSRSLTLRQAMLLASVCEFSGALGVGARVADTIRTKVIKVDAFEEEPAILMLAMTCALVGSSLYLSVATRVGLPVSTTHSIMGGVIGVGIATLGTGGVNWGWSGVSQVFAAWAIAPACAGGFGAIIFLVTKYGVMKRSNPVKAALITVPIYFAFTSALLTMLIVWKGAASADLKTSGAGQILGCIFGVAVGVMLLASLFLVPYLYRLLALDDWQLKKYHIFWGPLLLRRGPVSPKPDGTVTIRDYYEGHASRNDAAVLTSSSPPRIGTDPEKTNNQTIRTEQSVDVDSQSGSVNGVAADHAAGIDPNDPKSYDGLRAPKKPLVGPWYRPKNLAILACRGFFHGVDVDVVHAQKEKSVLAGDLDTMHAMVARYDNRAEHTYSFLQVLTAATASFAHGANDVSNAIGPLATIYLIWSTSELRSKSPVPLWILAFGGSAIVIGLWTYGYNIMRNLGNKLTLHSPSRGFSMELGSAVTVVMATRLALPVSTTQCITGATVGVGLCSGTWRTVNWRMVAWIYFGWFITLPCAGIIAGGLMGIILNAPQWGNAL